MEVDSLPDPMDITPPAKIAAVGIQVEDDVALSDQPTEPHVKQVLANKLQMCDNTEANSEHPDEGVDATSCSQDLAPGRDQVLKDDSIAPGVPVPTSPQVANIPLNEPNLGSESLSISTPTEQPLDLGPGQMQTVVSIQLTSPPAWDQPQPESQSCVTPLQLAPRSFPLMSADEQEQMTDVSSCDLHPDLTTLELQQPGHNLDDPPTPPLILAPAHAQSPPTCCVTPVLKHPEQSQGCDLQDRTESTHDTLELTPAAALVVSPAPVTPVQAAEAVGCQQQATQNLDASTGRPCNSSPLVDNTMAVDDPMPDTDNLPEATRVQAHRSSPSCRPNTQEGHGQADGLKVDEDAGAVGKGGSEQGVCAAGGSSYKGSSSQEQHTAELSAKLARVEHSRDELARQQGQYKATIAKLEGTVSSTDRRLRHQTAECEELKDVVQRLKQELNLTKGMVDVTPERCRASSKALVDEATRAHSTAANKEVCIKKLQELMQLEAVEHSQLSDFLQEERSLLVEQLEGTERYLTEERASRAAAQSSLAEAVARLEQSEMKLEEMSGQVYYLKERNVEMESELAQAQYQVQRLQSNLQDALASCQGSKQALTQAEQGLAETKEVNIRMFKQMKGIVHAIERKAHEFQKLPELSMMLRGLQEWVQSYQADADSLSGGMAV